MLACVVRGPTLHVIVTITHCSRSRARSGIVVYCTILGRSRNCQSSQTRLYCTILGRSRNCQSSQTRYGLGTLCQQKPVVVPEPLPVSGSPTQIKGILHFGNILVRMRFRGGVQSAQKTQHTTHKTKSHHYQTIHSSEIIGPDEYIQQ